MIVRTAALVGVTMAAVAAIFCPISLTYNDTEGDILCPNFIDERRSVYADRTYSSKTGYRFIGNVNSETHYGGCTALKIYMIVRHGTRLPKKSQILDMDVIHNNVIKTSCKMDFKQWKTAFLGAGSELTESGMKELYCLAGRFRKRFPNLFKAKHSNLYSFESTYKSRTVASALSFAGYLFHNSGPLNGYQPIPLAVNSRDDKILRFFDNCPIYATMVKNNETVIDFINQFINTSSFNNVQEKLQNFFDPDGTVWNITKKDVFTMYLMCSMETAYSSESIWCEIFSKTDLDILEYFHDLKSYWIKGNGYPINVNISCPLFNDIFQSLQTDAKTSVYLRFAHSETIIPLISALGLFKDKDLLSPLSYNGNRKFRVADITPFAGNIAFIVYQCEQGLFVRILVNEQDVVLQHHLCKYGTEKNLCLLDQLQEIVNNVSDNVLKFPCQFCI